MPLDICFLPMSGIDEPMQRMEIRALRRSGARARYGAKGVWFTATRTALHLRPGWIHYDYAHVYYLSPSALKTALKTVAFALDLAICRWLLGTRICWSLSNIQHHDPRPRRLERLASRILAFHCDWIRLFTEDILDGACRQLGASKDKFRVLSEGPLAEWYPSGLDATHCRRLLGLGESETAFVAFGLLRPYKGYEDLITAFRAVAPLHWRLIIAGSPYDRAYFELLRGLAKGDARIWIFGRFVPLAEVQVFIKAADVMVLPYKEITNSGPANLAAGFEKPVVGPRKGVLPKILKRQAELLYEPGGLQGALESLKVLDRDALARLGRENRAEQSSLSWDDFRLLFEGTRFAPEIRETAPAPPADSPRESRCR